MFHPIRNKRQEQPKQVRIVNPYIKYGYWAADPTKPRTPLNKPRGGGSNIVRNVETEPEKVLVKPVRKRSKPIFTKRELKDYPILDQLLNRTSFPLERFIKDKSRVEVRRRTCAIISPITGISLNVGTVLYCRGAPVDGVNSS